MHFSCLKYSWQIPAEFHEQEWLWSSSPVQQWANCRGKGYGWPLGDDRTALHGNLAPWHMEKSNGLGASSWGVKMFEHFHHVDEHLRWFWCEPAPGSCWDNSGNWVLLTASKPEVPLMERTDYFLLFSWHGFAFVHFIFCQHSSCGRCQVDVVGHNTVEEPGKKKSAQSLQKMLRNTVSSHFFVPHVRLAPSWNPTFCLFTSD